MKRHYYKPQMLVVKIVGRQQLLNSSGLLMNMPDYSQGGDGTNTYTGTKKAVLKEGKYYAVDIAVN